MAEMLPCTTTTTTTTTYVVRQYLSLCAFYLFPLVSTVLVVIPTLAHSVSLRVIPSLLVYDGQVNRTMIYDHITFPGGHRLYPLLTSTDIIILAFYFSFTFLPPQRATYLLFLSPTGAVSRQGTRERERKKEGRGRSRGLLD